MKRPLAVVAAVVSAALLSVAPAQAQQARAQQQANQLYFQGNLCYGLQCMNDTLGSLSNGNPIQWWHAGGNGEPNNDWNVWNAGSVQCTANSFPFYSTNVALLVDCQEYWSGDMVFKIAFAPDGDGTGMCIDQGTANPALSSTYAQLYTCVPAFSQTQTQYFIYSSSSWLVAVYATLLSYAVGDDNTYWLGTCEFGSTADGERVCMAQLSPLPFTLSPPPVIMRNAG
jgi:hypothetical protein